MSSPRRRAERQRELEKVLSEQEREECRRAGLTMWERIEECDADSTVKDILHRFAEHLEELK